MTNPPTPPAVTVEQVDRERAAELARWVFPNTEGAGDGIAEGHWDHQMWVQAFAAHRQQALAEPATGGGEARLYSLAKANNAYAKMLESERHKQIRWFAGNIVEAGPDLPSRQKWSGIYSLAEQLLDLTQTDRAALSTTASNPPAPPALVERPLNTSGVVSHETGSGVTQTPPAPSDRVLRKQAARVIDPSAWQRHDEILLNLEYNSASGKVLQRAAAERLVAPSLAKADVILALTNPAGEGGVRARALEAKAALDKYGQHRSGCNVARALPFEKRAGNIQCTCGLDQVRAALVADGGEAG